MRYVRGHTIVCFERSCAIRHLEGSNGGMVQFARHLSQLLADLPPSHFLVQSSGVAIGQSVSGVIRVKARVLQYLPLGRGQTLAKVNHPVAELCRGLDATTPQHRSVFFATYKEHCNLLHTRHFFHITYVISDDLEKFNCSACAP